jgi:hypothetical protein
MWITTVMMSICHSLIHSLSLVHLLPTPPQAWTQHAKEGPTAMALLDGGALLLASGVEAYTPPPPKAGAALLYSSSGVPPSTPPAPVSGGVQGYGSHTTENYARRCHSSPNRNHSYHQQAHIHTTWRVRIGASECHP